MHFIGVGGYSMSGLALVRRAAGDAVSGCDAKASSRTERLQAAGIPVAIGHAAAHVDAVDEVVYNSDVPPDHPERLAATARGIPIRHRSEVLAEVLAPRRALLVTGTHGKTTTTTMAGLMLQAGGLDPLVLVGGEVRDWDGANAVIGSGEWAVAEADESDGSFLRYRPTVAVVTSLEPEHLEHYGGSFDRVVAAVERFAAQVPEDGLLVISADAPALDRVRRRVSVPTVTYGWDAKADWTLADVDVGLGGTRAAVWHHGTLVTWIALPVPGRHNLVNALAALAAARHAGVDPSVAARALVRFRGARRRFEVYRSAPIMVVDDYAHHPTEIRATLAAARQVARGRVVLVFQPQRYSRTALLWDAFAEVLGEPDVTILLPIYAPPGEQARPGVAAESLTAATQQRHPDRPIHYAADFTEATRILEETVRPGDVVLTMGAGDVYRLAETLRDRWA